MELANISNQTELLAYYLEVKHQRGNQSREVQAFKDASFTHYPNFDVTDADMLYRTYGDYVHSHKSYNYDVKTNSYMQNTSKFQMENDKKALDAQISRLNNYNETDLREILSSLTKTPDTNNEVQITDILNKNEFERAKLEDLVYDLYPNARLDETLPKDAQLIIDGLDYVYVQNDLSQEYTDEELVLLKYAQEKVDEIESKYDIVDTNKMESWLNNQETQLEL